MHCVQPITSDLYYVGASDRRLALFENMFPIPRGVSYNSYVILDEKTMLLDTVLMAAGGNGRALWGQAAVQTVLDGLFGGALWGAVALWQGGGAALDHPAAALALWGLGVKAFSNVLVIVLNYLFSKLLIFRDPARRGPQ